MATDTLIKIKKLDEERAALLAEAKKGALAILNEALQDLRDLGFEYNVTEGSVRSVKKRARTVKDEPCSICGFKTNVPHDARSHRTQDPKRPFTVAELQAKGLARV